MILERLLGTRRSMENPSHPLLPDDWGECETSSKSASGVRVNRETALCYSPFWRAVNLVSRDVAKLPLYIYRRNGAGKERATDHPSYKLLRWKPNAEMTAFVFKQTITSHVLMYGNGYAYIMRNGAGDGEELMPLSPESTYPIRANGVLFYVTEFTFNGRRETRKLPASDVLHIKGLGFDGLQGYSVITKMKEALGLGYGAHQYGTRYFKNNARPGVIIEHPKSLTLQAAQRLRESWNSMHQGIENAHKVAVLEEGAKVSLFGANARDAMLTDVMKFGLVDVANFFHLPVHKVGGEGRTAFASLEQENQSYLDDALDPWLVNWEEECRDKLLREREKDTDSHAVEFMRQALIRADMAARGSFYQTAVQTGWMSRDEVRARENDNPIPDGEGSKFFIPLNMKLTGEEDDVPETDVQMTALNGAQIDSLVTVCTLVVQKQIPPDGAKQLIKASFPLLGDAIIASLVDALAVFKPEPLAPKPSPFGGPPSAPPEPEEETEEEPDKLRAAILATLMHSTRRLVKRIGYHARRVSKTPNGFMQWLDEFGDEHRAAMNEELEPAVTACGAITGEQQSTPVLVDELLGLIRDALLEESGKHTQTTLPGAVDVLMLTCETELPAKLAKKLGG